MKKLSIAILVLLYSVNAYANSNNYQSVDIGRSNTITTFGQKNTEENIFGRNKHGSIIINENINTGKSKTNVYQIFKGGDRNNISGDSIEFGRVIRK